MKYEVKVALSIIRRVRPRSNWQHCFRILTSLMIENVTSTTYFNIVKLLFLKKSQWSVDFLYSERSYDRNRNFYCTFLYIETMSYCKIQTDFFFDNPYPSYDRKRYFYFLFQCIEKSNFLKDVYSKTNRWPRSKWQNFFKSRPL